MCEPAHSIVQFPDHDPNDNDDMPFGGQMDMDQRLGASLGQKVMAWGKKIDKWFHFSKMGSGHTDSIILTGRASLILPLHTRYEGLWWNRKFVLDDVRYHGPSIDESVALKCAREYHERVVFQNMSSFRRFLETSIKKSSRPYNYVDRFVNNVLSVEGRDKFYQKFGRIFGKRSVNRIFSLKSNDLEAGIKILMGFTRKRDLFLPHWSDDSKLWI